MNFLSHLYLSGNSEGLIVGNFIADAVKGSAFNNFPEDIQKGILLHRKIDTFTDAHPVVELSKQRLRNKYKKYSGVIVDIYYDHFLAVNWHEYSSENFDRYIQNIYTLIKENEQYLPAKSAMFTRYMLEHNILSAYAKLEGIELVLRGMSRRATFESNMEKSIDDLKEHYDLFENEFKLFFPELQQFVNRQIKI
ncbi:MAG: acyl carrier protein phosphodiesterase [Bacteroidia bacterium]